MGLDVQSGDDQRAAGQDVQSGDDKLAERTRTKAAGLGVQSGGDDERAAGLDVQSGDEPAERPRRSAVGHDVQSGGAGERAAGLDVQSGDYDSRMRVPSSRVPWSDADSNDCFATPSDSDPGGDPCPGASTGAGGEVWAPAAAAPRGLRPRACRLIDFVWMTTIGRVRRWPRTVEAMTV
jgi:hypothetical protein